MRRDLPPRRGLHRGPPPPVPEAGTRVSEGVGEDEDEQASISRRPDCPPSWALAPASSGVSQSAGLRRRDRCSLNPCLPGGACRPSELPPGYTLAGLTLLEHGGTGKARPWFGSKGWPRPPSRAARLPVSGLVTGRGSEIEPVIRESQNPSPRWERQVVVQVCTE